MVLGAQLYTVRMYTQTEKDLRATLKKIADIGYKAVQISAIGSSISAEKVREICDSYSLKIVLTHTNPDRILNDTENVIREHNIMGCDYIGMGGMPEKYRTAEWYEHFAMDYKEPMKKIAAEGKKFMYHNHNFEFEKIGGARLIDRLMSDFTPEEMGFTLDTYWVQAGGADVCQWIEKMSGWIPCVHLKDMAVHGFQSVMAPVMEGNLNFDAILKACEKAGTKNILVEQDICEGSPFDCLQKSYNNLSTLGYK